MTMKIRECRSTTLCDTPYIDAAGLKIMSAPQETDELLVKSTPTTLGGNNRRNARSCSTLRRLIPFQAAASISLLFLTLTLVYHVLILTQIVPYEKVWGGRLTSLQEMYRFETVSVYLNLAILGVAIVRLRKPNNKTCLSIPCWIICTIYALNTVGNVFAQTMFEKIVFTPVTCLLSISFARLAVGEEEQPRT